MDVEDLQIVSCDCRGDDAVEGSITCPAHKAALRRIDLRTERVYETIRRAMLDMPPDIMPDIPPWFAQYQRKHQIEG